MFLLIGTLLVLQDAPQPKVDTPPSMAIGPMQVELTAIRERHGSESFILECAYARLSNPPGVISAS